MRALFVHWTFLFLIIFTAASANGERIAYWTFDETSGTTAANSGAGLGLDGTLIGQRQVRTVACGFCSHEVAKANSQG